MKTTHSVKDNLYEYLRKQELYLQDIDMSGSLFLEFKKTFKDAKKSI